MKTRVLWLMILFGITGVADGQEFPVFETLRYNEDYSNVDTDSAEYRYARLKHLALSPEKVWLSLGGSARYQFIKVENEDWGETPESTDGYGLARHLFHVDFHAGKRLHSFMEFQSGLALGKRDVSALDQNPIELHQIFVDYDLIKRPGNGRITLRVGRQEQVYGAQRLVSTRNGLNTRQAFDGIKVLYASRQNDLDVFYEHFVIARKGSFNDSGEKAVRLWGAYWVKRNIVIDANLDLYYLGLYKAQAEFDDGAGKESRHSIGARAWKQSGRLTFDVECLYQFGRVGKQSIYAWTGSIKSVYFFPGRFNPKLGLKTEIITGDQHYDDHTINTFNPLFPSGAYFGLAAMLGPSNLIDFHPSLSLTLFRQLEWNFDYDIFWRHSLQDGIYTNNGRLIYTGRENLYRFIGSQLSTDFSFTPCRFIALSAEFKWFICGNFLERAGEAENILFGMLSSTFTF